MKNIQRSNKQAPPSGAGGLSRRSFLKSTALAGGGLMLSFNWFSEAKAADKLSELNQTETWSELTGYIKITPENVI
jgi:isoquinoline 1-oxidoreductase beta subunit